MEKGYTAPRTGPLSVYETQAQSPSRFQRFSPGSLFSLLCCVRFSRSRARGEERRDCASPPNRPFSLRAMLRPKRKHVFSLSFWLATFRRFLDLAGRMRKLFAEDMGRPPRMQRLAPTRLHSFFSGRLLRSGAKPDPCVSFMKRFTSYKR